MKRLGENNLAMIAARVKADYIPKSNTVQAQALSVDTTPTEDSDNLITSGGVYDFVVAAIGGAIDETYPQNE